MDHLKDSFQQLEQDANDDLLWYDVLYSRSEMDTTKPACTAGILMTTTSR